jgi:hypothetical protein
MKKILFLLIMTGILAPHLLTACDNCGKRTIAFYDAAVLVPRPTGSDSVLRYYVPRWWALFNTAITVRTALRTGDPSFDCIIPLDGALLMGAAGRFTDTLTIGMEHANSAPPGSLSSGDYIFTGSLSGSSSNVTMELRIETALTREVVLAGAMTFNDMYQAVPIAQGMTNSVFSPIAQKIRDWEKKKRDSDPKVTINGTTITVTPVKRSVLTTEKVLVKFEYKDCDDVPLKGKTLYFNGVPVEGTATAMSTLGRFEKDSIVTDNDGKAELNFIPSGVKGTATLEVTNVYKYPFGATGAAGGHAAIFIETPPVTVWKIDGSVTTTVVKTVSISSGSIKHNETDNFVGHAIYSLLVEDVTNRPGEFHFYGSKLLSQIVHGSYQESDNLDHVEGGPGGMSYAERRHDSYAGKPVMEDFSFTARYQKGDSFIQIDAPFYRDGEYGADEYIWLDDHYGWTSWSSDLHDQVSGAYAAWNEGEATGSFVKNDSGYIGSGTKTTIFNRESDGQVETTTEQYAFNISPGQAPTGVANHSDAKTVPSTCMLYQNYPNPFNPSTTIRFFLPAQSRVRMQVFNILGQLVATLVDEVRAPGEYSQRWDAAAMSSGMYCCRLTVEPVSTRAVTSLMTTMMLAR